MRAFNPERVAAATTALVFLAGCSSQSQELASAEPQVTAPVSATPSETLTPNEVPTSQPPDTDIVVPDVTPTEKPNPSNKKAQSMGVVILDTCAGTIIPYDEMDSFDNAPGYHARTNIGELVYGEDYDESGAHKAICTQTPVSVTKILDELVMSIEKVSKYTTQTYSAPSQSEKPKRFVAVTTSDSLDLKYGTLTSSISCQKDKRRLADEPACKDGILSRQEIAEGMIAPSRLRAVFTMNVLKLITNKNSFEHNATLAIINFDLSEN